MIKTNEVSLIGGRVDGSSVKVTPDQDEVTIHEQDSKLDIPTGKHYVYKRQDDRKFLFDHAFVDGFIVTFEDGPFKGQRTFVHETNQRLLIPTSPDKCAAYDRQEDGSFTYVGEVDDKEGDSDDQG